MKNLLLPTARKAGFTLRAADDHIAELRLHNEIVARFSLAGMSIDEVNLTASRILGERVAKIFGVKGD